MAGRIGWMNSSGKQRPGMDIRIVAEASASPDDKTEALNAQAVAAGLLSCRYLTPVYTSVKCTANAAVHGSVRGVSRALAYGFKEVKADLRNEGNSAECMAVASHPSARKREGGCKADCTNLSVTGTELFSSK